MWRPEPKARGPPQLLTTSLWQGLLQNLTSEPQGGPQHPPPAPAPVITGSHSCACVSMCACVASVCTCVCVNADVCFMVGLCSQIICLLLQTTAKLAHKNPSILLSPSYISGSILVTDVCYHVQLLHESQRFGLRPSHLCGFSFTH